MSKKTILIVEDDKDMHLIYKSMLEDRYDLRIAENTEKAMEELKKKKPDLMILDIILPKESGEVFFQRLKKIKAYKSLKVLCITVLGDVSDFFQKIDPATGCLPKPLDKTKLLNKIKEMVW